MIVGGWQMLVCAHCDELGRSLLAALVGCFFAFFNQLMHLCGYLIWITKGLCWGFVLRIFWHPSTLSEIF